MASDREETVRQALAAFGARDLEALIDLVDPQIELRPVVSVWQRSYRGVAGVEEWFAEVSKIWHEFTIEADEISEVDAERMLVKGHWRGRATSAGSEVGGPSAGVITFRGDKVAMADFYINEEGALAALGQ